MIVIGADTHMQSHTAGAVDATTSRVIADRTVRAKRRSFDDLLAWARGLDAERVWAIEDCRHVSGALERFLLRRGEQVIRVAPKLTASGAQHGTRARQVRCHRCRRDRTRRDPRRPRHAPRSPASPVPSSTYDCSSIIASDSSRQRTALINDLRWNLHDLWPEFQIPSRALISARWQERVAGRLARAEQTARVRIARDELRRIRELTRTIDALHTELGDPRRRARAAAARRAADAGS